MNIETGCRAVLVNCLDVNKGKIVTVGKRIGRVQGVDPFNAYGDMWEIDADVTTTRGRRINFIGEKQKYL